MMGTVIVGIILLALAAIAVRYLVKTKKQGGCAGCSGGCERCKHSEQK